MHHPGTCDKPFVLTEAVTQYPDRLLSLSHLCPGSLPSYHPLRVPATGSSLPWESAPRANPHPTQVQINWGKRPSSTHGHHVSLHCIPGMSQLLPLETGTPSVKHVPSRHPAGPSTPTLYFPLCEEHRPPARGAQPRTSCQPPRSKSHIAKLNFLSKEWRRGAGGEIQQTES